MRLRNQVLRNLASNMVLGVARIVLGFLLVPFLIFKLGKEAYGLLMLSELTILSFEVFTVSVRQALSRHATYALSQNDRAAFIEYLSTGRVILLVSSAIVVVFGTLVSLVFDSIFRVPPHLVTQCKILFFLITLAFSAAVSNIVYWSVLYAKQRFDLINTAQMAGAVMRAIAIFVLFSVLPKPLQTLVTYGFVYWAMTLAENFTVVCMQRRVMPDVRMARRHFRRERVRHLLELSFHASMSRVANIFTGAGTSFLINRFWGPSMNAVYSVAMRFPSLLSRFFVEPTWSLTPTFTDLAARLDGARLERLFYFYSKLIFISVIPVCLGLMALSRPVILAWVGPEFDLAARVMPFFIVPLFWAAPCAVLGCVTYAYGKLKVPAMVALGQAVLSVTAGALLGRAFAWELFGFAVSAIVAGFAGLALFGVHYTCHVASLSARRYWREVFAGPALLALPVFGAAWALGRVWTVPVSLNAPFLILYAAATALFYGLSFFALCASREKKELCEITRIVFPKLWFGSSDAQAPEQRKDYRPTQK